MIFGSRRRERLLGGFFMEPVLPFALEFLLLAPLVLGADVRQMQPLYLFLAPYAIGNWIQARLFMATDFAGASVLEIPKSKAEVVEAPPVYFVETVIQGG